MLASLWIAAALAGSVEIEIDVELEGETRHVFVDGKHRGEAKGGKDLMVTVPTGKHEVAIAYDADAHWLVCIGEVDARKDFEVEVRENKCTSLEKAEARTKDTVRVGGLVSFTGAGAKGTVEIAGRKKTVSPGMGLMANVSTGTHDVSGPGCEGKVTVKAGELRAIAMADGSCVGLDEAGKKKKKK